MKIQSKPYQTPPVKSEKPRIGFLGAGWIGRSRMKALHETGAAELISAADIDTTALEELKRVLPDIRRHTTFEGLMDSDLDGVVIATPNALHADQALSALKSGKAVFCQKPLGIHSQEVKKVVETARSMDLLLRVDFSYRYTKALKQVRETVLSGEIGTVYGIQLTFHNAYGPDKSWYYNPALSGGGCLMDLGIHLIDLLFWIYRKPLISNVSGHLLSEGIRLHDRLQVEDFAAVQFILNDEIPVQLSCSWNLPAGKDAVINARFFGTKGGVSFRNLNGSFYDFITDIYTGTSSERLISPPDLWSGRGILHWVESLGKKNCFDPVAETYTEVADSLELLYQNAL